MENNYINPYMFQATNRFYLLIFFQEKLQGKKPTGFF